MPASTASQDPATLDDIERQLAKARDTADNLEALSDSPNCPADKAAQLSAQAAQWRLQQFMLYRQKEKIVATSKEWQAAVAGIELVNERIQRAVEDIKNLDDVLTTVATVLSVFASLASILAAA